MEVIKAIKLGHVEVAVKRYTDGRYGYDTYDAGKRYQHRWRDSGEAVAAAKERVKAVTQGKADLLNVSREEWSIFTAWRDAGLTLETLAQFNEWRLSRARSCTVESVANELLESKRSNSGIDASWMRTLNGAIMLFMAEFKGRQIMDVSTADIDGWLTRLRKEPRRRNNIRNVIVQLFRFARTRKHLPHNEPTAAEQVEKLIIKAKSDDIEIYTPNEMRQLIACVKDDLKSWAIIGGFAGVRTEELRPHSRSKKDPLRWEDIQWDDRQIFVRAETAKTGRQRYIPMSDNLFAWLAPYRQQGGPIVGGRVNRLYEEISRIQTLKSGTGAALITYRKNGLRHSYGSYRNAVIRNIGQLADEMGNSPAIARRNYERPQPRSLADAWFGIMP